MIYPSDIGFSADEGGDIPEGGLMEHHLTEEDWQGAPGTSTVILPRNNPCPDDLCYQSCRLCFTVQGSLLGLEAR